MELEVELLHLFRQFALELPGIRFSLESNYDVVSKPHHDDITVCVFSTPRLDPQIKQVVEINVSRQRRCTPALEHSFFHSYPLPILQHDVDIHHPAHFPRQIIRQLVVPFPGW